jgi:hypothetical protein
MSILEPSRLLGFYQEAALRQIPRTSRNSDAGARSDALEAASLA